MQRIVVVLLLLSGILGLSEEFTGKCVGVADGDTVTVLRDSIPVRIRLAGIDAPESHQDFGTKAKQHMSGLVFGKGVRVVEHEKDRYGRTVADIFVGDVWANLDLVKAGLAWHYKAYSKDARLVAAEESARSAKTGLWSHPNPVPPWDFRRNAKSGGEKKAEADGTGRTVYITKNGTKHHRAGCKYLQGGGTAVDVETVKVTHQPCKVCRP
jgi:endonuclease YncB( thermonuclease family)